MPQVRYGPSSGRRRPGRRSRGRRPRLVTAADRERLLALHEAAHAIIALALGQLVSEVSIEPDFSGNIGHTVIPGPHAPAVFLAGPLALWLAGAHPLPEEMAGGQQFDWYAASSECMGTASGGWRSLYIRQRRATIRALRRHWPETRALAARLLRERTVYEPILPALA